MTIDLNDIPIGVAESQYQLDILKSGKIYKELLKMSEKKIYLYYSFNASL